MLISTVPPPLPAHLNGLGFDPMSILGGGILNAGASIFSTIEQGKIAKKQAELAAAALKEQKTVDARNWALQQVSLALQPSESRRQEQIIGLAAVGGVAVLLSAIFLISAAKGRKAA